MLDLFGLKTDRTKDEQILTDLSKYKGSSDIKPADLPDLVTFADITEPKSVMLVDRNDLEAILGPGVRWKSVELALTDEPVTSGIEAKLLWVGNICSYLDGSHSNFSRELSNTLSTDSFKWPLHC